MGINIKQAVKQAQLIKQSIIDHFLDMPSNPDTQVLSGNPSCYTINFSKIGDNWSTRYHSMESQARMLIDVVKKTRLEELEKRLRTIIASGGMRYQKRWEKIHPIAIAHTKKILED